MKRYLFLLPASLMLCSAPTPGSVWAKELPQSAAKYTQGTMPAHDKELVYSISTAGLAEQDKGPATPESEQTQEEKMIDVLKEASSPPGKPQKEQTGTDKSKPDKTTGNPKDRQISYNKDTDSFRTHVEAPEWQRSFSDRRSFGVFARNYTNRIHCEGVITDVIYPTTKGLELELKNKGHDLFVQVGPTVPADITYFPVDLNIVCQGEVFQINAVVDAQYAGTNMELVLSGGIAPDSLQPYENSIFKAKALPHEEQLAKILSRVWNQDYLPYWAVKKHNRSCGFGTPCKLRVSVDTGINELVAWDFLAPAHAGIPELLARLSQYVTGEIIGIGRVQLKEAQRVIILSARQTGAKK